MNFSDLSIYQFFGLALAAAASITIIFALILSFVIRAREKKREEKLIAEQKPIDGRILTPVIVKNVRSKNTESQVPFPEENKAAALESTSGKSEGKKNEIREKVPEEKKSESPKLKNYERFRVEDRYSKKE